MTPARLEARSLRSDLRNAVLLVGWALAWIGLLGFALRGAIDLWLASAWALLGLGLAIRAWRRPPVLRVSALAATFATAFLLTPFSTLHFWNTVGGPLTIARDASQWMFSNAAGGYHPHEALPLPLYLLFLPVALAPILLCAALVFALPVGAGLLVARALDLPAARRHRGAALTAALVGAIVLLVAQPTSCDTHESWDDVPNKTCTCTGFTLTHYTPGHTDGASTDYCMGIEQAIP